MTTRPPHWKHQLACVEVAAVLWHWVIEQGEGMVLTAPLVVLADQVTVAPDVVWLCQSRLETVLNDDDGCVYGAPDLVVEVLAPQPDAHAHDHVENLVCYEQHGVREYWIVDRWERQIACYRLSDGMLDGVGTYTDQDILISPMLPGFLCPVAALFQ